VFILLSSNKVKYLIVKPKFLEGLKEVGLNSYEAKIWTALLSRGVSTAGELSDIANVPRSRSYDVLESLEKKGFVVMKIGKPIKYIAVPPKEVLERVKKNISIDTQKALKNLDELDGSDVIEELTFLHQTGLEKHDVVDYTGSIKGKDNLYSQLNKIIKDAEQEIILVSTEDFIQEKATNLQRSLQIAKDKGVNIKIAAPHKDTPEIQNLKNIAEIKNIDLKARFCIVDKSSIVFMLTDGNNQIDPAIWVNTGIFAKALSDLFELAWKKEVLTQKV
jgi:HTH-type transcriptional regulator, sugar sensing transcriptional regulator